jgi:serine/threonine protein kinase/alpha-tubulin suppressor-like RCC1 family protein/uncharacterized protein YjdB
MADPVRCTRCGSPLAPGAHFCSKCGFDVSGEQGGLATAKMTSIPPTLDEPDPQAALLDELRQATLGEFEIKGELGRGGMASVFLAHEIALDRKVAIKVMSPSLLQSGRGMADRFKREARTAAALSHPHIIPIYGVRESGRLLFFVMKYVQGRSLDAIVKQQGELPIKMVQAILAQTGNALDYAHRHGVIHRDIKPANIMLDVEGWAVITDFGIAKVTESQGLTMTGATIGTPTYMSPEQCAAKEVTAATDQYSLGITAYEMLTGKVPFDADSLMGLMWHHFHDPPPPLAERRADCPPELVQAIERMLAKQPAERWPTLEDAVNAIGTPPLNDPIRREMKALARGGVGTRILAEHHTPVSPPPRQAAAPTTPAPTPPPVTSRPPSPPAPAPPPPPPAPTVAEAPPHDITTAPTTAIPAPRMPTRAPAPRPAPPPPSPRTPAPAPATKTRRGRPWLWIALVVGAAAVGIGGWLTLRPRASVAPEVTPPSAPPPPAPVAAVAVTPTPASIAVGGRAQLKALLSDSTGHPLTREIAWSSSDSTMARVSAGGLVSGLAPGIVTVSATSEGHTGVGTVIVTATVVPVARVDIEPAAASVSLGESLTLIAAPKDADGNTLSGRAVTWSSGDRAVAPVSAAGTVTGLREGNAQILVVVDGKRATARVTVTPARVAAVTVTPPSVAIQVGERQQLAVRARDARGNALSGRAVAWSSSDPRVALVNSDGAVVGVSPGQASVTAEVESQRQSVPVTIAPVPVASVTVAPPRLTVAIGARASLVASASDARGRALDGREVNWSTSDPAIAQVSPTGSVTGVAGGSAVITATIEGKTASANVTVPAPPPPPPVAAAQPTPTPSQPTQPAQPSGDVPPSANTEPAAAARTLPRRDVAAGGAFSCGITDNGTAVCWGNNAGGQTGDASGGAKSMNPVSVPSARGLGSVVAGDVHACGLTQNGSAVCWGSNTKGQLGSGRTSGPPAPVPVKGTLAFTALAAGARHTCGLTASGAAWCWGDNNSGQLGDGTTRGANEPQRVRGDTKFKALAAGSNHTCGLSQSGQVWCWGDGFSGQLGRGTRELVQEPVQADLDGRAIALAAGGEHTCALVQGGSAFCWGANKAGEIGDGSKSERERPTPVSGGKKFASITAGETHTCALTATGDAYCWGRNRTGQLGDGSTADRQTPVKVGFDQPFQSISAGATHTCGVTREQVVVCWGGNASGQLGDGSLSNRATPAPVQAAAGRP